MNHQAIIAQITQTIAIPNADNIQIGVVLGEQVVISKDWQVGMVGVYFPVEVQLSEDFTYWNNLNRNKELNADKTKSAFFDTNRKVRAQPFMKVKSEGFFAGLECLSYLRSDWETYFKLGDRFSEVDGNEVCRKYISEATRKAKENAAKAKTKKIKVIEAPLFKEHVSTAQFKHNLNLIPKGSLIYIQAKIHGSSARQCYTQVTRKLPTWKSLINKVLPIFKESDWEYIVGTRRVALFQDQANKEGFHGKEAWRFEVLESLKPFIKKNMTIYGEISGYANGKPIMAVHNTESLKNKALNKKYGKNMVYKYGCTEGQMRFHVYRITLTTEDGTCIDYSQAQIDQWCADSGVLGPVTVHPPFLYDGDTEALAKLVDELTERPEVLCEDYIDPSHISEGVIVRVETGSTTPLFLKSKSFAFRCLEGIASEDTVDLEDAS